MKQEVAFTQKSGDLSLVVEDLCSQLKSPLTQYNAVIFFASSNYDFAALSKVLKEKFMNSEVIGTSTSGEISAHGFTKNSIVLTAFTCPHTRVSGVLIDGVDKFPIIHKGKILDAMHKIGIRENDPESHKTAFAINFVNGLCNAEEAFLSLFYAVVQNEDFVVAGGSAGDDLKFQQTYVSYNGETISDGAAVLFVKTSLKFDIRKENIYRPSGKQLKITKVDTATRRIFQINGAPAATEYAEAIGRTEANVADGILDHPFGRVFGDKVFISSLASFNPDKSINMYCRVLQNSVVDLLEPADFHSITANTCKEIKETIRNPQFVMFINCILRTITFDNKKFFSTFTELYKTNFPVFCGFSSYGEQFGPVNSNQTLVTIVIGE